MIGESSRAKTVKKWVCISLQSLILVSESGKRKSFNGSQFVTSPDWWVKHVMCSIGVVSFSPEKRAKSRILSFLDPVQRDFFSSNRARNHFFDHLGNKVPIIMNSLSVRSRRTFKLAVRRRSGHVKTFHSPINGWITRWSSSISRGYYIILFG